MVIDESGKSQIRDRVRVHYSSARPIVHSPMFNVEVPFEKTLGLSSDKIAKMNVTMTKSFYLAGEMAYILVNVDNS